MNLDDLTIGELRKIASLAAGLNGGSCVASPIADQDTGKYVVVRTFTAGVHCGVLVSRTGQEVRLKEARRLWQWYGAKTLHGVSQEGVDTSHSGTNVDVPAPEITITQAIEVIPCSDKAAASLRGAKWNRK